MSKSEDLQRVVERILRKNNVALKQFMATNLARIASELLAKGLIDKTTEDKISVMGKTEFEHARVLMDDCWPSLELYPEQKFPKFIAVLKKFETMKKLAIEMEQEFNEASQSPSRPVKTTPTALPTGQQDLLNTRAGLGVPELRLPILVVLLAIVVGGVIWFVQTPPATPSSTNYPPTCEWPLPNSDPVKSQVMQIKMELGVEEIKDNLKTTAERVRKALSAGEKCHNPELQDKMNLVDTTLRKIKEKLQGIYGGFDASAKTALTDLKSMWKFAVQGKRDEAVQRIKGVCDTTESLEKQLDSLKGYMDTQASELRQALEVLGSYQEKTKVNYESRQHKLQEERHRYKEELSTVASLSREAEQKAQGAATQAQKETEAWEKEKANKDAFGSNDQSPFEKRRARFLKDQRTFEAEAEDHKRSMEQIRLEIARIGKDNETANIEFKCISDAITKMREAVGSVSMPTVSVSLLESLKAECTDLHNDIKSIDTLGDPKGPSPSQVCGKAKELFTKWQALLKVN